MSAPSESNQIDEFAGIEPAPARRSPVLALVIIGLAAVTCFHLRDDLRYALSPKQAVPLEVLRGAGETIGAPGRYATVRGIPDRSNALYIEQRGGKTRETFFRILDSETPLFVRAHDTTGRSDLRAEWTGRLRRFGDVSYAASLREYFEKGATVTRAVDLGTLKAYYDGKGEEQLRDRRGNRIKLDAATPVQIVERPRDYAIYMSRTKFPKAEDAERELARVLKAWSTTIRAEHDQDTQDDFVFLLPIQTDPAQQNALFAVLEPAGIDIEIHRPVSRTRFGACQRTEMKTREASPVVLVCDEKGKLVAGWDNLAEVLVEEPLRIADDALVLSEGESPGGYTWAPLLAALLLALGAYNVWYLLRPRRA